MVILTWNRVDELMRTVAHSVALPERPEVVVVDNGSQDGSAQRVSKAFPDVKLVRLPRNIGAAARNHGVKAVNAPYVAFSDDDTLWSPGSLAAGAALLDAHSEVAVLCARVLVGPERREDRASLAMASSPLPGVGLPGREVIGFMAGACLFRREAFIQAGGYEPQLFIGAEESLLSLDIAALGWRLVYTDAMTVHHLPSRLRDDVARRPLVMRNLLWAAWGRRSLPAASAITMDILRDWRDPQVRAGLRAALARWSWVLARRRVVPPCIDARFKVVEQWLRRRDAQGSAAPGARPPKHETRD
jgi:GT2 family glycosyltransferase